MWHCRLGHIGHSGMKQAIKAVTGVNDTLDFNPCLCSGCAKGNHRRSPKPKLSKTPRIAGRIFSDICIINHYTIRGEYCFIVFLSDVTRESSVELLRSKGDAPQAYDRFKTRFETQHDSKVRILRTDNEGEFRSDHMTKKLQDQGVIPEATTPYSSYQNPAERCIQTICRIATSMMEYAGAPSGMWGEAVHNANYTRNLRPTASLKGISPVEKATGVPPDVSHLRTFGCEAWAHVPESLRDNLGSKGRRCIFLGYGQDAPDQVKRKC